MAGYATCVVGSPLTPLISLKVTQLSNDNVDHSTSLSYSLTPCLAATLTHVNGF